jgi:hypothetical protein
MPPPSLSLMGHQQTMALVMNGTSDVCALPFNTVAPVIQMHSHGACRPLKRESLYRDSRYRDSRYRDSRFVVDLTDLPGWHTLRYAPRSKTPDDMEAAVSAL